MQKHHFQPFRMKIFWGPIGGLSMNGGGGYPFGGQNPPNSIWQFDRLSHCHFALWFLVLLSNYLALSLCLVIFFSCCPVVLLSSSLVVLLSCCLLLLLPCCLVVLLSCCFVAFFSCCLVLGKAESNFSIFLTKRNLKWVWTRSMGLKFYNNCQTSQTWDINYTATPQNLF